MIKFPYRYKKKDLKIDFNWNKSVTPCKEVKITLGKKSIILTRGEFSTLMAVFADEQQMEDIIQTNKIDFVSITRMLKIKTTKDLKAEESLIFPYTYWIPRTEYEKLKEDGEMVKLVKDSKKDLLSVVADSEAGKEVREMMLTGKLDKKVELST